MTKRPDILIYGMNFSPELTGVGRYSGELARGLSQLNMLVEVITSPPHYPGWYVREPYSTLRYLREVQDGVSLLRCPIMLYRSGEGVGRLLAPLSFAISSALPAIWSILRRRPRVVLCVEPTLLAAPVAFVAAKVVGARTVLHVQDLEVDAAFAVGHLADMTWKARIGATLERWIFRRCDAVVTISQEMARRCVAKGVSSDRLHVVRNWVETAKIYPLDRPSTFRQELGLSEGEFVVLYAGQIGRKQALEVVLHSAERLEETTGITFVVAGDGPLKKSLVARFGSLKNVRFIDLQPEYRLNELLNLADVHILPQNPAVQDLVLPSKIGGMLASGKDILVIAEEGSELAAFLGDSCFRISPSRLEEISPLLADLSRRKALGQRSGSDRRLELANMLSAELAISRFKAILNDESFRENAQLLED